MRQIYNNQKTKDAMKQYKKMLERRQEIDELYIEKNNRFIEYLRNLQEIL